MWSHPFLMKAIRALLSFCVELQGCLIVMVKPINEVSLSWTQFVESTG